MLTTKKTPKAELWPTLGPTKEPVFTSNDFPSALRNPSSNVAAFTSRHTPSHSYESDEGECYNQDEVACAPPEFKNSFGSAIAEALTMKSFGQQNSQNGSKGKKKKGNKTLLFTTGGRTFDGN